MATSATTKTFRFLTAKQVIHLHARAIAKVLPTQPMMLDSAVRSPMNIKHYTQQENVFQLAANLSEKIMKNHAFQDGNKRTALLAADMFLKINGYKLQRIPMSHDHNNQSIADAHVAVTTNQWSAEELGRYYEGVATPIDEWTEEILVYRNEAVEY